MEKTTGAHEALEALIWLADDHDIESIADEAFTHTPDGSLRQVAFGDELAAIIEKHAFDYSEEF